MKYLFILAVAAAVCGCHHNEFDVSADQVQKHMVATGRPGMGMPDLNHLPPGAVKHEQHFKKGDRLPDGQIADHDMNLFSVQMQGGPGPAGGPGRKMIMNTDDVRITPSGK